MDTAPPPRTLRWPAGEKLEHMETWSQHVMADARLTKAALRIAWTLVFSFHSKDARAWETKETLARRTGMSVSSIKSGLISLERAGHIIRVLEIVDRKRMRVIRPCVNDFVLEQEPRKRRGGKGSEPQSDVDGWWPEDETPRGSELMTPEGFEDETPCIMEESLKNPGAVEDVANGLGKDPAQEICGIRCCECPQVAEYEERITGRFFCGDCAPLVSVLLQCA